MPDWLITLLGVVFVIAVISLISWSDSSQQDHSPDQFFLGSPGGLPPSASYKKEYPSLVTILARWWLKRKGEIK